MKLRTRSAREAEQALAGHETEATRALVAALRHEIGGPGPDATSRHLEAMLNADRDRRLGSAVTLSSTEPARARWARNARRGLGVAVAIPVATAGLAFAGVSLPAPAQDAFDVIHIELPNQTDRVGSKADEKQADAPGQDSPGRPGADAPDGEAQPADESNPGRGSERGAFGRCVARKARAGVERPGRACRGRGHGEGSNDGRPGKGGKGPAQAGPNTTGTPQGQGSGQSPGAGASGNGNPQGPAQGAQGSGSGPRAPESPKGSGPHQPQGAGPSDGPRGPQGPRGPRGPDRNRS